jgi:predicted ATPase
MESFNLQNIKSFVNSDQVEIKPITVFLGKNSSGKSSLIRFPIVLKQTVKEKISPLLFYGKLLDYGNFEDVVFNHEEESNVSFQLTFDSKNLKHSLSMVYPMSMLRKRGLDIFLESNEIVTIDITVGRKILREKYRGDLEVKKFTINLGSDTIFLCEKHYKKKYLVYFLNEDLSEEIDIQFMGFVPNIEPNLIRNNLHERTEDSLLQINILLRGVERLIDESMEQISYIGPFRRTPERNYRYQEANALNIGADGEYTSELLASYYRKDDVEFFNMLNDWLERHLKIHIHVEELKGGLYRVMVEDLHTGVVNNIRDVGFGLSQVLPIIVQVLINKRDEPHPTIRRKILKRSLKKINIFEQPELHLHPAAQSNLADLFIHGHRLDKRNHFLIETHSEHLILRLRRRILEGAISSKDVAFYFIQKSDYMNEGSYVERLHISEDGDIENWPEDFFDQDFEEILTINNLKSKKSMGEIEW